MMTLGKSFRLAALAAFTMLFAMTSQAFAAQSDLSIPTGERTPLAARLILPEGRGPFPTLIIAPGQGYDMDQPLTGGLAKAAAQAGFASLRFDWRFYREGGAGPSEGLTTEVVDLKVIISFARNDNRLDADRIFLAGKSLGTIITWRAALAGGQVRATYLLTPICRQLDEAGGNALYPGLLQTGRPVVLVSGNRDPLCPLPNLYTWLGSANDNVSTLVFAGNHAMKLSPDRDTLSAQNEQRAIEAVVHWLSIHNRDLDNLPRHEIQE